MLDPRYLLFLVAVVFCAQPVHAQPEAYLFGRSGWSVSSSTPAIAPAPEATSDRSPILATPGHSRGGSVGLAVSDLLIIRGSLNFSRRSEGKSLKKQLLAQASPGDSEFRLSDGNFALLSGAAELLFNYNSADRLAPYFLVGCGYYQGLRPPEGAKLLTSRPHQEFELRRPKPSIGLTGGLGLRVATAGLSLFAESRALFGFLDHRKVVLPFNAGVAFHLGDR